MSINKKVWKSAVLSCGLLTLALFASCGDDVIGQTPTDGDAPGQVSDVQVTSIPGGAEISYTLPKDEDLLYVEARYKMKGKECNLKASCFTNKLIIQGYADMDEHDVELVCVDRSKNSSAPVSAKFTPLENPVYSVAKSVEMANGLGGITITWQNATETAIKLYMYAADDAGAMQLVDVVSSEAKEGDYALHGYDDQTRRFAVLIKDHWDNPSDTIAGLFTPRYEKEVPTSDFKRFLCPEDNNTNLSGWGWEKMFDNVTGVDNNGWHVRTNGSGHGVYFTVDLGHKVQLTRIKLWQRGGGWPYRQNNARQFEIYTRADSPESIYPSHGTDDKTYWSQGFRNDSENWTHLMHCITPKPSGFDDFDNITAADKEYAYLGHEYIVDENAPAVRYVRFTIDETWGGGDLFNCNELKFYGKIVDE